MMDLTVKKTIIDNGLPCLSVISLYTTEIEYSLDKKRRRTAIYSSSFEGKNESKTYFYSFSPFLTRSHLRFKNKIFSSHPVRYTNLPC